MLKKINEIKKSAFEPRKSFDIKKELCPDVWEDSKMKSNIRERLIIIANEYLNTFNINFKVLDIILIGSLASYNWSEYSDFDLHILTNYDEIDDNRVLVEDFLKLHKKNWNKNFNITIKGYDVELYVDDVKNEKTHINGIFSILNDKWVIKPKEVDPKIDINLVEVKAAMLMEEIEEIELRVDNDIDFDLIKKDINDVWDKIKKYRKDGIASPEGEFSTGNLIFKYLRRNEYIGRVVELKQKIVEKKYSMD